MQRSPHDNGPRRTPPAPSRRTVLGLGAALLATATGCTVAGPPSGPSTASGGSAAPRPGFRFGAAGLPDTLDPALAIDNESFRITRQIFEGLVGVDPNTGSPTPALATGWQASEDGLTVTFALRDRVLFHDGTAFDANAVVANFQRWSGLTEKVGGRAGRAFELVFHHRPVSASGPGSAPASQPASGDARDAPEPEASGSYYAGCRAADARTFILYLRRPLTGLIEALTMPGFGIASPAALRELDADNPTADASGRIASGFGRNPVGTGPFVFTAQTDEEVTLEWNPRHWRAQGQLGTVAFEALRDPASRLRALRRRDIDGYDMVTLDELRELVRGGQQILQRDPFSVFYLGMNRDHPALAEDGVRRAAAHAVNRQRLIEQFFIAGTKEARGFVPPSLGVPDAETYFGFNENEARELLAASGYDGEPIPFAYPLNITRAYLPLPERIYAELSRQLTAVGFNIRPVPIDWSDGYLDTVLGGKRPGFHLLGWNGSYRDPDHFVGSLFGDASAEFGYESPALRARLAAARSLPNGDARATAYQEIGEVLANDLPALPIAYPISAVAASDRVVSYPSSPVLDEVFDRVTLAT